VFVVVALAFVVVALATFRFVVVALATLDGQTSEVWQNLGSFSIAPAQRTNMTSKLWKNKSDFF